LTRDSWTTITSGRHQQHRLRRDRREPTTGKITAAMTANKAGIHSRMGQQPQDQHGLPRHPTG